MVYVTQAYPGMKPYLKGFPLLLETWQGGRDSEGLRVKPKAKQEEEDKPLLINMEDIKQVLLTKTNTGRSSEGNGPLAGITMAVPRFKDNLEALILLTKGEMPAKRCDQSCTTLTAYYGFGDVSSAGFSAMVEQPDGLHG